MKSLKNYLTEMALNNNSIKAEVKKKFPTVKIKEITHHKFGMFSVKVSEDRPKSVKHGFVLGETDFDKSTNGVVLDEKIEWS